MNYYIDNVFEIKSIFNKEKIDYNFNINENSLFIFKYNNVKRYDCAIFLGNENYLLLIKLSINITKKQLKQYELFYLFLNNFQFYNLFYNYFLN